MKEQEEGTLNFPAQLVREALYTCIPLHCTLLCSCKERKHSGDNKRY